jgi:omega-amidase
MEQQ